MRLLPLLFALLLPAAALAQDALPKEAVDGLKQATVFLRVSRAGQLASTGSGFLISRGPEEGYLLTNAHVVDAGPGGKVDAVFWSGTDRERVLSAELLASDRERDLALLHVTGKGLPEPLAFQSDEEEARETLPVYVVGFPLGEVLAAKGQNPRPTISRASIASLRKTPAGPILQLDGELNPGNSGGPVVGPRGTILGVAVAKIEGTNISFAVPRASAEKLLEARVFDLAVERRARAGATVLQVRARLIDPTGEIERVELRVGDVSEAPPTTARPISGESHLLRRRGTYLEAEVVLAPALASTPRLVQTRALRREGRPLYSVPLVVAGNTKPAGEPAPTDSPADTPARGDAVGVVSGCAFPGVTLHLAPDPSGQGVFLILPDPQKPDAPPRLVLWDLAAGKELARIAVPLAPSDMAVVAGKLVVSCADSSVIVVVDPATRKVVQAGEVEVKVRGQALAPRRVIAGAVGGKAIVFCQARREDRSAVPVAFDLATGEVSVLGELRAEHLCPAGEFTLLQDNFGGSPSGIVSLWDTKTFLDASAGQRQALRVALPWKERELGRFVPVPKGVAATNFALKTSAYSLAEQKLLWERAGGIVTSHPRRPVLLLSSPPNDRATTEDWPLSAVDARSGQRLWARSLRLPQAVCPQIARAHLTGYMPNVVILPPWELGTWAQQAVPWSPGPAIWTEQGGVEWLVFALSEWQPVMQLGRRGLRFQEVRRGWFKVRLPELEPEGREGEAPTPPPTQLKVGDELSYRVAASPAASEVFVLTQGPDGMKVDAKTGELSWTPSFASLGKHRVEVALEAAGKRRTVLSFVVRVRSK